MFKRWTFGMTVGIPRRNVEVIQHASPINQLLRNTDGFGKFAEQFGNDVAPRFLPFVKMERFYGFLLRYASSVACGSCPPLAGQQSMPTRVVRLARNLWLAPDLARLGETSPARGSAYYSFRLIRGCEAHTGPNESQ